MNTQDTTKEAVKARLDKAAVVLKDEWHSQACHKAAVGTFWMDLLEITKPADRDTAMKVWAATPASFGANASAMAQQLGRETKKAEIAKTFAGF